LDISNPHPDYSFDEKLTIHTVIHEFDHIQTSSPNQRLVGLNLVKSLADTNADESTLNEIFLAKTEECLPRYTIF